MLGYATLSAWNGRIVTKPGSIAVDGARSPYLFWLALALIAFCGLLALAYGLAKLTGRARSFTGTLDRWIGKNEP